MNYSANTWINKYCCTRIDEFKIEKFIFKKNEYIQKKKKWLW